MRLDETDDSDIPPKKWLRARGTPILQLEIAADGGLGPRWTEEIGHQQVKNLLGPSEYVTNCPLLSCTLRV